MANAVVEMDPSAVETAAQFLVGVHVADRYNWNPGMGAGGPLGDTKDDEMLALHRAGLAREYDMSGSSDVHVQTVAPAAGPAVGTGSDPRPHAGSRGDPGRPAAPRCAAGSAAPVAAAPPGTGSSVLTSSAMTSHGSG